MDNNLDPEIWGPHYWFVLFSIAYSYPNNPNNVIKKKYYEFIQNLPLFIPHKQIGNDFIKYLDKYPVTPYLDNRLSFMKWIHFIHNKMNIQLRKPVILLEEAIRLYEDSYLPKTIIEDNLFHIKKKYIWGSVGVVLVILLYYISKE